MLSLFCFLFISSLKIYKKEEEYDDVDEVVNIFKFGFFYSLLKLKFLFLEGRGRVNISGSDSLITNLIILEEDSDVYVVEYLEDKYSNRDVRYGIR